MACGCLVDAVKLPTGALKRLILMFFVLLEPWLFSAGERARGGSSGSPGRTITVRHAWSVTVFPISCLVIIALIEYTMRAVLGDLSFLVQHPTVGGSLTCLSITCGWLHLWLHALMLSLCGTVKSKGMVYVACAFKILVSGRYSSKAGILSNKN